MKDNFILLAERQHGLVTIGQARAAGLTRSAILHRLASGRWEPVGVGVYRLAGTPRTWEQRLNALVLASGPSAAASHRSAAALLAIPGFSRSGAVEVVTPRPRRHRDPTDRALAQPGRKGIGVMRVLLDERSAGHVPPASELEACFVALVGRFGLPEPVRQFDAGDGTGWVGRVDFAYPTAKLLIELDSHRHHSSKLDREADAARDRRLRAAGWRVERFGWEDVTAPQRVVALLRAILSGVGDDPTGPSVSDRHQLAG